MPATSRLEKECMDRHDRELGLSDFFQRHGCHMHSDEELEFGIGCWRLRVGGWPIFRAVNFLFFLIVVFHCCLYSFFGSCAFPSDGFIQGF